MDEQRSTADAVERDLDLAEARDSWVRYAEDESDNVDRLVEAGCTRGEAFLILMINDLTTEVRRLDL